MVVPESASRRALLAAVGSVVLAGCTVEYDEGYEEQPEPVEDHAPIRYRLPSLPTPEVSDEYEIGIESGLDADITDRETFEAALEQGGIDVDRLERERNFLFLEYVGATPETGVLREVGYVAGAYVPYVLASDDPATLDATILDGDGREFGRFTGYINWVRAFDAGDEPLEAYGERVVATLKTKR